MGDTTTLTIRIDESLKTELEQAAAASDRSVTEFVVRSVKAKMAPQCVHCGRSDLPVHVAGFSREFGRFLDEMAKRDYPPMTIATIEGQLRIAYWGRLEFGRPTEGFVPMVLDRTHKSRARIVVPRALVVAWADDHNGEYAQRLMRSGYVDGTAGATHTGT